MSTHTPKTSTRMSEQELIAEMERRMDATPVGSASEAPKLPTRSRYMTAPQNGFNKFRRKQSTLEG